MERILVSLSDRFAERWMLRGEPIPWPPRSSDLTPRGSSGNFVRLLSHPAPNWKIEYFCM